MNVNNGIKQDGDGILRVNLNIKTFVRLNLVSWVTLFKNEHSRTFSYENILELDKCVTRCVRVKREWQSEKVQWEKVFFSLVIQHYHVINNQL